MITTAELLLGLSRHLGTYALGPDRAALGQLEFAGNVLEMAVRLRQSGVSQIERVGAIGLDAGVTRRTLLKDILPTLDTLGWIDVQRDSEGTTLAVSETIPPLSELLQSADQILRIAMPEPVEFAVLEILSITIEMPTTHKAALHAASEVSSDEEAVRALDYLEALHLVTSMTDAADKRVVFNPNIWSTEEGLAAAAVRAEDSTVRAALSGLLEQVAASPGLPEDTADAAPEWINYAVAQGLVHRSLVVTSEGVERAFLFSPHLGRQAFEATTATDPSGHVRQLIGSMIFAKSFARTRLYSPTAFLNRLINEGEAGDASSIGSDYPMLETSGIVRVEPASRYYKLVLLQSDVAEEALSFLRTSQTEGGPNQGEVGLRDQRRYVHPERERARRRVEVGRQADTKKTETKRILAALRESLSGRRYG